MQKLSKLITLGLFALSVGAAFGTPTLVTNVTALGTTDPLAWTYLGADGTVAPATSSPTTVANNTVGVQLENGQGLSSVVGTSWSVTTGPAMNGDTLLWAYNNSVGVNAGSGPVKLTFNATSGVGAAIQADAPGQFTAVLKVYNGTTLLSTVTETSNANGDAIFIGALDTTAEITAAEFSVSSAGGTDLNDFALDTVYFTQTPTPISVTVGTSPAGLSFSVDGTTYTTSQTLSWQTGSTHTIATTATQAGATGVQSVFTGWSDSGTVSHSVTANAATPSYTATFKAQYLLTTNVSPANSGSVTGGGVYYDAGSNASVSATPTGNYAFVNWTGPVASANSASTTVPMSAPQSVTANFQQGTVPATVGTNTLGASFTVDSVTYTTTQQFNWVINSTHTIATTSPQPAATGAQNVFTGWSDGGTISHTVTAVGPAVTSGQPVGNVVANSFTANFKTQYLLTTSVNPANSGTVSGGGTYYDSGSSAPITATANASYAFTNWTGSVASANSSSTTVSMTGPQAVTANFSLNTVQVTVYANGELFSVDGGPSASASQSLSWTIGSNHTIATASLQAGAAGVQYLFANWSDGGAASHSVTASATVTSYVASFQTQYLLTTTVNPVGAGTLTGGGTYYTAGSNAAITATPTGSYSFVNWTGGTFASATSASTTVAMTAPLSITANFQSPSTSSSTAFVTGYGLNSPSVRNDFSGWVGMQITGGPAPLSLTSLGRVCVTGNSGTHIVKLVNAGDSSDVAGGTVTLNMAGCTVGQFVYAPVSVTLPAGSAYFLVSHENSGGDKWYDYGTIATTTAASVPGVVYSTDGSSYIQFFAPNNSYVPVNFQYATGTTTPQFALTTSVSPAGGGTIAANPSAPGGVYNAGAPVQLTANPAAYCTFVNWSGALSGSANPQTVTMSSALTVTANFTCALQPTAPLITGYASTSLRNDFGSFVGMTLTVGANPLTVTSLGRACIAGNSQTHTLKLVNVNDSTDVVGSSVTVNMAGCTPGQFAYAPVSLVLPAGNSYHLVSLENSGGDKWYDYGAVTPSSAATIKGSVYYYFGSYIEVNAPNTSYVPVNLQYGVVTQTQYLLTTNIAPPGGGSVTANPSAPGNYYNSGASVQLTAIPAANCTFTNWSGGLTGTSNPQSINMTQAQNVTANFQCSAQTKTSFVTGFDQSATLRNDFGSWVGMKLTVGANPLTVLSLGRVCIAGNARTHTVKLVNPADGTDVAGGTVTINMANCTPGSFMYTALAAPLTLPAGGNYYLASLETAGGDQWYDHATVASTTIGNVTGSVYFYAGNWYEVNIPNTSYVPVSLQY